MQFNPIKIIRDVLIRERNVTFLQKRLERRDYRIVHNEILRDRWLGSQVTRYEVSGAHINGVQILKEAGADLGLRHEIDRAGGGVDDGRAGDADLRNEIGAIQVRAAADRHPVGGKQVVLPVDRAVVTVPAYFNDAQRQATKDAGKIAGLEVLRLVNEPTAAALAYGLHEKQRGHVAVYDLGGGTFDISVLKLISTSEGDIYQVLSTNGDTHLGGDDIDNALQSLIRAKISEHHRVDVAGQPELAQELRKALITAKHQLSDSQTASIRFALPGGAVFAHDFTRADFDAIIKPIVDRTMGPVKQALADAHLKPSEIDEIVLVGGTTRTPLIRATVENYFGRKPHTELNPDEVVALGAAVQANILDRGVQNMLLLDVTPLSLGIETYGGAVAKVIPRNSTIPASAQEMYTTGVDNQTGIDIHVLQGERELAKDCRSLARFVLKVPPSPAGLPRIEVKFLIDANGILQVAAKDLRNGEQHSIEVQPSYGLNDTEIERMLEESIEYAEQDFAQRQVIEARTESESILTATQKALTSPAGASLPPEERAAIDKSVATLKESVAGDDYKLIRKRIDELNHATERLAELVMNGAVSTALEGRKLAEV